MPETFTEDQIVEACKRLPFSFTDEEVVLRDGKRIGEVGGQFRMRQAVECDLETAWEGRTKADRERISQVHLRDYLSRHMAAVILAALKGDAETLARYSGEAAD